MSRTKESPQNRFLRFYCVGTLRVPRIFPAFHTGKMALHPCRESPVVRNFPDAAGRDQRAALTRQ